jgi:hypothetical protein
MEQGLIVCGVELHPEAVPIQACKFRGDTVFMLGNEGTGLLQ